MSNQNRTAYRIGDDRSPLDLVAAVFAEVASLLRSSLGFAHVDLIPDRSRLVALKVDQSIIDAFDGLRLAVERDRARALPATSGPDPLGLHVEVHEGSSFHDLVRYGPYSIGVHLYFEEDRAAVLRSPVSKVRPEPAIEMDDSAQLMVVTLCADRFEWLQGDLSAAARMLPIRVL